MFPVIEVQCPYCKATGQIMTPPLGSLIVGPCPRCNEMVLLFDGTVLPLDKAIISEGTAEEKKHHLLETIVDMTASRVDELVESGELGANPKNGTRENADVMPGKTRKPSIRAKNLPRISREDVSDFVNIDLHLIDSKSHFNKAFATKKKNRTRRSSVDDKR